MKKLISILLAAALCTVLCVPALAETPMDASAVLFGNGFPIVANTSNEELDEKAAEDEAFDDEMELEKKPGGDKEEEFGNRPDDVDIDKDDIKPDDDEEEPDKEPDDEDEASEDKASDDEYEEPDKNPGDDSEEPEKRPGDDSEELDKKLGDDSEEPDEGSVENNFTIGVGGSILSAGNIILAAVIGGGAVLAIAGVVIYKKKR